MNAACRALHDHLSAALRDIDAGWSIGSFGAIGEFHQRADDLRLDGAVFDRSGQHAEEMDADNPGHEGEPS